MKGKFDYVSMVKKNGNVKKQLLEWCQQYVEDRIATSQRAIAAAQQSANEDTKSSMGDKYETGRAMAQLEIEKNTAQLHESLRLKQVLARLEGGGEGAAARLGSLVRTNRGNYFLSISVGKVSIEGEDYFAISPQSPIGNKLMGLSKGAQMDFNGQLFNIVEVE